jgi:hypothetical protein
MKHTFIDAKAEDYFIALVQTMIVDQFQDETSWDVLREGEKYSFTFQVPNLVPEIIFKTKAIVDHINLVISAHLPYYQYYEYKELEELQVNHSVNIIHMNDFYGVKITYNAHVEGE